MVWSLNGEASVGRSRQALVRLNDERVSRVHAHLETQARGILVRDAESRHGSFVNGHPVTSAGTVAEYDSVVRFGDTLMLVVDDVEGYRSEPRRLEGTRLGLSKDMLAGTKLAQVWDQAARIAQLTDPVFILGESGSGKECVARIVHAMRRGGGPFVGLNVAAIPESLFEAELFGYERGAFTGATVTRNGAFRDASGGVLFLDEVGDLRSDLQSKLLRAIDLGSVRPLGASRDVPVDVRLVAATSCDLREACQAGTFRMDLYYRLTGIVIRVPPLRDRRDDILLLGLTMLEEQAPTLRLSADAAEMLALAPWEGNVRNLRYAVTHAVGQAVGLNCTEIQARHLPDLKPMHQDHSDELTEDRIRWAMRKSGGIASHAAEALGVSRTTLYKAIKRFAIDAATLRDK
jgi:transcriptional regulator with PAS, ATPase and Fis domain